DGPRGAHIVTWMFAGVFLVSTYKLARHAGVAVPAAVAICLAVYAFPLVYAQSLQIQLDLPLASMILASYYCFLRRHWLGWMLFGSAACLIKLYGFLFVFPATAVCLLSGREKTGRPAWQEALLTLAPL